MIKTILSCFKSIFLLFVFLLFACTSQKIAAKQNKNALSGNGSVSPLGCLVTATVINISPFLEKEDPGSPCSKVPCNALIRIDEVYERGSSLTMSLNQGMEVSAHFVFTLSETSETLFPGIKKHFPGLKINDKFKAILQERAQLNSDSIHVVVYEYNTIK